MSKCINCSAPLPKNSVICEYCGTRNDVDLNHVSYKETDMDLKRICPRCGITLKTINLNIDGDFFIEKCEKCFGLFFDPMELNVVLESQVDNHGVVNRKLLSSIRALDCSIGENVNRSPYIKCPICGKLMNRQNFGFKSGVIVNSCVDDGIWLDNGCLKQLLEWKSLGGDVLDKERQERISKMEEKEKQRKIKQIAEQKNRDYEVEKKFYVGSKSKEDILDTFLKFFS